MPEKAILFDLDGTLLPMDQDLFLRDYFRLLCAYMAPCGYEPQRLIRETMVATEAMLQNDGSRTNEERFWEVFSAEYDGERDVAADRARFEAFYETEFAENAAFGRQNSDAIALIRDLRKAGVPIALATNPVFPTSAVAIRIRAAGLSPDDFLHITSYENTSFAKPSLGYYRAVAAKLSIPEENCLMVGNDPEDDLPAALTGMQVFLLTDCLVNRNNLPFDSYPHGDFPALRAYLQSILT